MSTSKKPISPFFYNFDHPIRSNLRRPLSLKEKLFQLIQPLVFHEYFGIITPTTSTTKDAGASIRLTDQMFRLNVDVQHFSLADITVKTGEDVIVIEGKHDEKEDEHGFISREFRRQFRLPRGCDPDTVRSRLSSDGVLTITAPRHIPSDISCSETRFKGERGR